jgi:hypothetical protein
MENNRREFNRNILFCGMAHATPKELMSFLNEFSNEKAQLSPSLIDIYMNQDEIEILVEKSIQCIEELRNILYEIYLHRLDQDISQKESHPIKFGLHYFQNSSLLLGKSMINNGILEGFNSIFQAAKAKARGYSKTETIKTII